MTVLSVTDRSSSNPSNKRATGSDPSADAGNVNNGRSIDDSWGAELPSYPCNFPFVHDLYRSTVHRISVENRTAVGQALSYELQFSLRSASQFNRAAGSHA
jgi:hypothetical protein